MFKQILHYDCIAAIVPSYTSEGDITTIIFTNGNQQKINRRIHTVLKRLARSHSIDLIALKKKSSLATGKSNLQPLPLAPGLVLSPLKIRRPQVSGDLTMGYINFHSVIDVSKNHTAPYHSTIRLIGGTDIPILWTPATVKQHLQQARLAISYTAYDPDIPPELSIHIYHIIKGFYCLASFGHSPDQNFVPIP